LAKTHGRIVVEGLSAAGMLRQKGLSGARVRRRGLSDAALATPRRHLSYKGWYGSRLVVADRWFRSSKTCHACGHVQDIGWAEHWQCAACSASHQRHDDNASINLARYENIVSVVGPVGAAVKRGADRKTRIGRAGGCEARKKTGYPDGEHRRDGLPA
jgi:putative transposase